MMATLQILVNKLLKICAKFFLLNYIVYLVLVHSNLCIIYVRF